MGGMKKKEIKLIRVWRTRKWLPPSLREKARHVFKDSDFIYENEEITLPFDVDSFIEEKPPNKRSKPENETVSPPREIEIEGKSDSEIEEESNSKRLSDFDSSQVRIRIGNFGLYITTINILTL